MSKIDGKNIDPPKLANRLLGLCCKGALLEEIEGDLFEHYQVESVEMAKWKADLVYWFHMLNFLRPFALKRHSEYLKFNPMIVNNFKMSYRNMMKNKGFSVIHILGLVMGIASALFILTYVDTERRVDQSHVNKSRVFRIDTDIAAGDTFLPLSVSSGAMGPAFMDEYAEVIEYTRVTRAWSPLLVKSNQGSYFESDGMYADNSIFKLFDFDFLIGSAENALENPFQVVLSYELAKKYYGDDNPLGKFLEIDEQLYSVNGVLAEDQQPSHLAFSMLISFKTWINNFPPTETNWGWKPTSTYVLLADEVSHLHLGNKLPEFIDKYMGGQREEVKTELYLNPLSEIYFGSTRLGDIGSTGNKKQLYLLLSAAVLIIILALSNFINLSSARASTRMKEVGVRKVLGAYRTQLIQQFFTEAILLTFLSTVLAAVLYAVLLPKYSMLIGKHFELSTYLRPQSVGLLATFAIGLGFLSGLYPALMTSAFKPADALKNKAIGLRGSMTPRKLMSIFQFFISIGLLMIATVMWKQFRLIESTDLGFSKDQTIVVNLGQNQELLSQYTTLKNELMKTGLVSGVSFSSHTPGEKPHSLTTRINVAGEQRTAEISLNIVDQDFLENYGIALIAGRGFTETSASDTSGAIILNEKALAQFGFSSAEEAIGLDFDQWGRSGKVIGVIEDFHYQSLHQEIEPLSLQVWPSQFRKASIKISTASLQSAISSLSDSWLELTNEPFNYAFLDSQLERLYVQDYRFGKIFRLFTILSIIIACLGLIGLSSFIIKLKTKELAIRKVLGAVPSVLFARLLREFGIPVLIAFFLAIVPAFIFLNDWLSQFAYRVEIKPVYAFLPVIIISSLVILSVVYQSSRLVLENPVKSLKDE